LGREHVIYKQRWISPRVVVSNYFAISGRDVALSSNQSPVLKFYRSTYTDYEQREEKFSGDLWNVRAMQLWNDWNTQVNAWATRHSIDQKVDSNNDNKDVTVDYMWMRSEDLLPGSPQRLECLHALAKFVGSTLTPEQLCKLSQQVARDYGKSIDFKVLQEPKPPPMDTGERWKQLDRNNKKVRRLVRKASTRRRLQDISATRTALSRFLQDFETWKDLVQSEVRKNVELSKDVVLNVLIDHGNDLRKKWDAYAFDALTVELKVTRVSREDILVLIQQLRVKLQETRLYNYKQKKNERPGGPNNVTRRYGKWQAQLANNTELAKYFYQEGAKGLELFGYYPAREIHYQSVDQATVHDCPNATAIQRS
jgi:hypothetical protein